MAWCDWLTTWYNQQEKRQYKRVQFTLPSATQWEYAARGGHSHALFPWGGPFMQNNSGQWLANFSRVPQGAIARVEPATADGPTIRQFPTPPTVGFAGKLNDNADVTAPVRSYSRNDYGLYNMAGNVAEFVQEPGITKGGSWNDTGYYLQNGVAQTYADSSAASNTRGFRFMMQV